MLNSEEDWKRGARRNRIIMVLVGSALVASGAFGHLLPVDRTMLFSTLIGAFCVTVMLELLVFRKPKSIPSAQEQATLETRNMPTQLISALTTWGFMSCFIAVQAFDLPSGWQTALLGLGALLLLASLVQLPGLLRQMRLSRVAPALNDERSQHNMNRAYRGAFLLMFQTSFLGGAGMMLGLFTLPAQVVAFGIGLLGISSVTILWSWYEWRDSTG